MRASTTNSVIVGMALSALVVPPRQPAYATMTEQPAHIEVVKGNVPETTERIATDIASLLKNSSVLRQISQLSDEAWARIEGMPVVQQMLSRLRESRFSAFLPETLSGKEAAELLGRWLVREQHLKEFLLEDQQSTGGLHQFRETLLALKSGSH